MPEGVDPYFTTYTYLIGLCAEVDSLQCISFVSQGQSWKGEPPCKGRAVELGRVPACRELQQVPMKIVSRDFVRNNRAALAC